MWVPAGRNRADQNTCTGQGTSVTDVLGIVGLIALLLAPIVTTAYLAYRLKRRSAAAV